MDVDICLSNLLDLYPQQEIARARRFKDELKARPCSMFFQNGSLLCNIQALTINQTRSMAGIIVDGSFHISMKNIKSTFSPEFNYEIVSYYLSETDSLSRIVCKNLYMTETTIVGINLKCFYQATSLEISDVIEEDISWT